MATESITNLPDYCVELINKIAKQEGFTEYVLEENSGSNHGDGFQGIILRVLIKGKKKDAAGEEHKLYLICKMPPLNEYRKKEFSSELVFTREVYAYEKLLPAYAEFQREKGISNEDGFFEFPKCYGTYTDLENCNFVIVLEDLKAKNYQMVNKYDTLDYAHAKLVIQELGKFHGTSFAVRDQKPDLFAETKKLKMEMFDKFAENKMTMEFFVNIYKAAIATLNPDQTKLIEKMEIIKDTFLNRMIETTKPGIAEPFSVVSHGDCWNNNIMYAHDDSTNNPNAICLIDWQMSNFVSPAIDLTYFLFSSTEKQLRDEHYDDLINIYYDTLATQINRLGSDAKKLFTFNDLQLQLKQFAIYGLIMAPLIVQIITADPKDIPDLDQIAEDMKNQKLDENLSMGNPTDQRYIIRMRNVIIDYFERYDL